MSIDSSVTILADTCESSSSLLPRLQAAGAHVRIGDLECGSYVISGSIVVLRFTAQEFVEAIIDGMLFHKAGKASMNFQRIVFLVEGDIYSTRAVIAREAIDGALSFLVCVEGASILYVRNPIATADLIFRLAKQAQKNLGAEMSFQRAKVAPGRQESLFALESVAGIGPSTAPKALDHFRSVFKFVNASVEQLMAISGIGQKKAERIYNGLRWEEAESPDVNTAGSPTTQR
ncbi:DNA-binding protein [Pseudomonas syringae pv. actinidiae]|nr:DNA-binding protein [Pseudomonas syringae pv. actinidiae]